MFNSFYNLICGEFMKFVKNSSLSKTWNGSFISQRYILLRMFQRLLHTSLQGHCVRSDAARTMYMHLVAHRCSALEILGILCHCFIAHICIYTLTYIQWIWQGVFFNLSVRHTKWCVQQTSDRHPYQWEADNKKLRVFCLVLSSVQFISDLVTSDAPSHTFAFNRPCSQLWSLLVLASHEVWHVSSCFYMFHIW